MSVSPDYDEQDLEFMDPQARLRALGVQDGVDERPREKSYGEPTGERLHVQMQPPVPGRIVIDMYDVAKRKGLVHPTGGAHSGLVNLSAIQRGTGIAYTTLGTLFRKPEPLTMLHLETIARICDFLECQPGDFLRYTRDVVGQGARLSEAYKRG